MDDAAEVCSVIDLADLQVFPASAVLNTDRAQPAPVSSGAASLAQDVSIAHLIGNFVKGMYDRCRFHMIIVNSADKILASASKAKPKQSDHKRDRKENRAPRIKQLELGTKQACSVAELCLPLDAGACSSGPVRWLAKITFKQT